jgi:hypothetical protein
VLGTIGCEPRAFRTAPARSDSPFPQPPELSLGTMRRVIRAETYTIGSRLGDVNESQGLNSSHPPLYRLCLTHQTSATWPGAEDHSTDCVYSERNILSKRFKALPSPSKARTLGLSVYPTPKVVKSPGLTWHVYDAVMVLL